MTKDYVFRAAVIKNEIFLKKLCTIIQTVNIDEDFFIYLLATV